MTRVEIDAMLKPDLGDNWASYDPEAQTAFCNLMQARRYGREETMEAWLWFVAGWDCREPFT